MSSTVSTQMDPVEEHANIIAQQFLANGANSVAYLGVDNLTSFDLEAHRKVIARIEELFHSSVKSEFIAAAGYWSFKLSSHCAPQSEEIANKSATAKINPLELSEELAKARLAILRGKKNSIPRPMNRWMLWSTPRRPEYKARYPELTNQQISGRMAVDYHKLPAEEVNFLQKQADQTALIHSILHPGYKYRPRKAGEVRRRQRRAVRGVAAAVTPPQIQNGTFGEGFSNPIVFNASVSQPNSLGQSEDQQKTGPPDGVKLADMTPQGTWTPEDPQQPWRTAEVTRMPGLDEMFSKSYGLQEADPATLTDEEFMKNLTNSIEEELARMDDSDNMFQWAPQDMSGTDTGNAAWSSDNFDFNL
ncbi:uncharacterized protein BDZ99DRAFT_481272 [Mytilinidion resinicola]|uniref:HMG box domain-containing protein n=1 Tax=Mytilinidion resinicola TaxID=574789 RepID=A0A6A6Y7F5_9PEZI|nr:uncharacterized protein BDZ99DRAFT_481272 [Mytilinidion resinicola]KAF2804463.1 hypothetical protein BDZ99DRAFT_481272 [Mytilinidion resinicola]